jgi:membrane protein YdbS with pleckstrin-like domain
VKTFCKVLTVTKGVKSYKPKLGRVQMTELTQQGISALKAGDKQSALKLLRSAIQNNPKDIQAWLWLSGAVDTNQERVECLQAILKIDPNNQIAIQGLAQLVSQGAVNLQVVAPSSTAPQAPVSIGQNNIVSQQEKLIFKDHPAWGVLLILLGMLLVLFGLVSFYFLKIGLSGLLLFLFGCPMSIAILIPAIQLVALWATSKYTLTNKKLIVERGLFTHQRKVIPIERIQDVSYRRVFIQFLFGVGDVIVESAGERGQVSLRHLRKYRERFETILSLIQKP